MYIEGDIFKIDGKEYKLRFINKHNGCWLEPVLHRNDVICITGGMNRVCPYEELDKFEYMNVCY